MTTHVRFEYIKNGNVAKSRTLVKACTKNATLKISQNYTDLQ